MASKQGHSEEAFDIVIKGGRAIDPETYLDGVRDVGITGDRIVAVSPEPLHGRTEIEATGMIVAPGFIDPHAHGQTIASGRVQAFDGVTTHLELEVGILPVAEFYDATSREGRPINFGASAGWGFARVGAFNPERLVDGRPVPKLDFMFGNMSAHEWVENTAGPAELRSILDQVEQGLREGGIGIGVAWGYAPGAGLTELHELWKLAAKYDRPTYTHVQYLSMVEPDSGIKNHIELVGLAAATGARTHVCHVNSTSLRDVERIRDILVAAQRAGLRVTTEAYPWGAGMSAIGAAEFDPTDVCPRLGVDWSDFTLVKTLQDFATKDEFVAARTSNPGDSVIVHFLREDERAEDASLLDQSVLLPGTAICTDALPYVTPDGGFYWGTEWPLPDNLSNHPRAAGCFSRFLRLYARERAAVSWMDAMRSCSLNTCQILEDSVPAMRTKGRLQAGMDADVVVFDPESVSEMATWTEPLRPAKGMRHVIVNGTLLIRDETLDTTAMPGRAVRAPIVS